MPTSETNPREELFTCPRCQSPTPLANLHCSVCGVNLVMAVARAAREVSQAIKADLSLPYEADKHLPRFGEFLVQNDAITQAQLQAALERQQATPGQHRTIGQILLEMGMVNREQLDRASLAQIQQFQTALQENKKQLMTQGKRIRQLESTLTEIADINFSATNFVSDISSQLWSALAELKRATPAPNEPAGRAIQALEKLINELRQFSANE